jgi:hypothetical protein
MLTLCLYLTIERDGENERATALTASPMNQWSDHLRKATVSKIFITISTAYAVIY